MKRDNIQQEINSQIALAKAVNEVYRTYADAVQEIINKTLQNNTRDMPIADRLITSCETVRDISKRPHVKKLINNQLIPFFQFLKKDHSTDQEKTYITHAVENNQSVYYSTFSQYFYRRCEQYYLED